MRTITNNYIAGQFRPASSDRSLPLHNPATEEQIGTVRLSNADDVNLAVAAAKAAWPAFSVTPPEERVLSLQRLAAAVANGEGQLIAAMREEYGAPAQFTAMAVRHANSVFLDMAQTVTEYPWRQAIGRAEVEMRPLGIAAAITPWNSNIGFICAKLATAVAAGSPIVIKPSEMSAIQTETLIEVLHQAELPAGVLNIVNGDGAEAGALLAAHPDVAKVSFTGSTATGRAILRAGAETMKRITLELGGKGAQIILDDADLDRAVAMVLANGFINSGQACIAGTRILVSRRRKKDLEEMLVAALRAFPVGPATDPEARIGPMVSQRQWDRVQAYIALGSVEGARLLAGGPGRPADFERGWFVRPTLFTDVHNDMRIAREEIFGPVLSILAYEDEADALRIANDTTYGLQNYVFGGDEGSTLRIARQLESGRTAINGAAHEPRAPFGGFKQSGIGREFGVYGLTAFLEPRVVVS